VLVVAAADGHLEEQAQAERSFVFCQIAQQAVMERSHGSSRIPVVLTEEPAHAARGSVFGEIDRVMIAFRPGPYSGRA
jgi:hypothetical protein